MTSPELNPESSPPIEMVVAKWLEPWAHGTRRLADDPLPFRMIHAIAGSECVDEGTTDWIVSIHTFAAGPKQAVLESDKTHRRMVRLANTLSEITIPTGQFVAIDYVKTRMMPTEVEYDDDPNVVRYVARYDIGLSYTPAP